MTTRLDLRTAVRIRLEDTGLTPLWPDIVLNDALWTGMIRLSSRLPTEATIPVPIAAGETEVALAEPIERFRLLRVLDENGDSVPEAIQAGTDSRLTWRLWADALLLSQPLAADATWSIEYRAIRTMPADDATDVAIATEHEPILIAFVLEIVLRLRAVEEMKRLGNSRVASALANDAMAEAERLIRARRRSSRSRFLVVR